MEEDGSEAHWITKVELLEVGGVMAGGAAGLMVGGAVGTEKIGGCLGR